MPLALKSICKQKVLSLKEEDQDWLKQPKKGQPH